MKRICGVIAGEYHGIPSLLAQFAPVNFNILYYELNVEIVLLRTNESFGIKLTNGYVSHCPNAQSQG